MRKVLLILLVFCSRAIFSQEMGVGVNIQISCESDVSDDGTSKVKIKDNSMELGGSFHYFKTELLEYEGALLVGFNISDNGVSETRQTFFGLNGGMNFHILNKGIFSCGVGGRVLLEYDLEPRRDPALDYDRYFEDSIALELPIFLDVSLNEHFMLRFSAVAAGFLFDIQYEKDDGVKETVTAFDFYTTTTSNTNDINWFPFSIYFIYKI